MGEDRGKMAAASPSVESGLPIAVEAKPKISTWANVTGIDIVWTSRTVEACAPMVRKTAPSSR